MTTCPNCSFKAVHMHNRCLKCHIVLRHHKEHTPACECGNEDAAMSHRGGPPSCEACGRVRRQ